MAARLDPLGWGTAARTVGARALSRPYDVARATGRLLQAGVAIPVAAATRALGVPAAEPFPVDPRDRRFADPAWEDNAAFFALRQLYLAGCRYADDLLEVGAGGDLHDGKAALVVQLLKDALAPTNFPLTNPDVLITAFRSGGRSVLAGARFAAEDAVRNGGMPVKVDTSAFTLGDNLAATPGTVVYRNDLVELIQYHAQTDTVHARPILGSPPWINKYYVMDLAPGRSFFEWAVQHGHTVFTLSYRDPDSSMSDLTMDDYLQQGPLAALEVIRSITGSDRVDIASLCLGGALATMTAAYLAGQEDTLGSLTLLNTMVDYSSPGVLATMVDPVTLERLAARMGEKGYLPAGDMALTFDLLRANDLIFNYVVSRWFKGVPPTAFDVLAWNGDSTRMPAAMHSAYLQSLYVDNALARGEMALAGRQLDVGKIESDTYVVGAINDHIVPWQASYATRRLLGGDVRYVLSSGGHIAGIVNPPSEKSWWEATAEPGEEPAGQTAEAWRDRATRHRGSWWEDWAEWSAARAGAQRRPPKVGNRKYTALGAAPGTYVYGDKPL